MLEALLHVNIAQSLFTAIIILTKRPLNIIDKLLSSWLVVVLALFVLRLVREEFPFFSGDRILLAGVFTMAFPSFLYLYIKYLTQIKLKFQIKDLLHFAISGIFLITALILLIKHPSALIITGSFENIKVFTVVFGIAFILSFILYGYYTLKLINNFQKKRDDYYSFHNSKISIDWIRKLSQIFYIYYGTTILLGIFNFLFSFDFDLSIIFNIGYTIFLYIISFNGYKQVQLLKLPSSDPSDQNEKSSYKNSGLKETDALSYEKQLLVFMEAEKPWLNPEISIKEISDKTEIPQHFITQILNERLNKNFYTLINEYRTEEVIRLFQNEKFSNWNLIAIAYEAGFNSKSSFNAFFKKHTGETPSNYRKRIQISQ